MAVFDYQAIAQSGKKVKGIIDADSPTAARRKLREQSLFPTNVEASATKQTDATDRFSIDFSRVSTRDLSMMTRPLAVLLNAGMPLVESISALLEQTTRARLKKTLFDVRDKVREGASLGDAIAEHSRVFPMLYVNMVRAGESSGALESVLYRMADILDHQAKMKHRVLSTLAYPAFMGFFALAIITFLVTVIVPRITSLFEKQGQELPQLTKILIASCDFIGAYWYLLIGGLFLALTLWRFWVSRPSGRVQWDHLRLRIPLFGSLHLKLLSGRYARTMGTMLQSGLTMMKALEVVITVLQNSYVEKLMQEVKAGVRGGRGLAAPMKDAGVFPPMLLHMVDLGQRSGELEDMLIKVADTYDDDVQVTIDGLVSLMEPLIIVVMGGFVGLLVLSILLPILNMSTNMGN